MESEDSVKEWRRQVGEAVRVHDVVAPVVSGSEREPVLLQRQRSPSDFAGYSLGGIPWGMWVSQTLAQRGARHRGLRRA